MENDKIIYDLIERIASLYSSEMRRIAVSYDMHDRHIEALAYLEKCNRYSDSPQALSQYLGLTKGTVSQTLNTLEKKELITKFSDSHDSRKVHLKLTRDGKNLLKKWEKEFVNSEVFNVRLDIPDSRNIIESLRNLLRQIQVKNAYRTFGQCYTCKYFVKNGFSDKHQCGLTSEPLSEVESLKICREHELNQV
jgi:MarR family transcriptional regulator, negative regulator of the multidrug operon emrRAB